MARVSKKQKRKAVKKRQKYVKDEEEIKPRLNPETKRGMLVVFLSLVGAVLLLAHFGLAGKVGEFLTVGQGYVLGSGAWLVPILFFFASYLLHARDKLELGALNYVGLGLFILAVGGLFHLFIPLEESRQAVAEGYGGGALGFITVYPLEKVLGRLVTFIILIALFVTAWLLMFNTSLERLTHLLGGRTENSKFWSWLAPARDRISVLKRKHSGSDNDYAIADEAQDEALLQSPPKVAADEIDVEADDTSADEERTFKVSDIKSKRQEQQEMFPGSNLPKISIPTSLLTDFTGKPSSGDVNANQQVIKKTLDNFKINVEMSSVNVGPTVTQYTFRPAEGVKLSKITALSNDLALALAAHPIRIEAPIPGKSLVGIEVPNQAVATVSFRGVITSPEFKAKQGSLKIALGRDVAGAPWIADLGRMPHMLIAGATGSGKTVALNTLILSLVFQHQPSDLKLILVDPKRVELPTYNDIPHLLTPVITDVTKTINALRWVVGEMDRRFNVLSNKRKRDITSFNAAVSEENRLPYIVLIIDELADLMSVAAAEVEAAIVRLAQMARAVGIHLVVATQRPSVDIITGLIKANITSRIAFSVASQTDSRTILDSGGAEKLLGRGDMLFTSAEISKPRRLQGAYVADKDIEKVVGYLKSKARPDYHDIVTARNPATGAGYSGEEDEMLEDAKEVVIQAGKASASFLQRRLRVGYARAARLLDLLEDEGIIGPADGAKPRDVYVDEYEAQDDFEEDELAESENDEGVDEAVVKADEEEVGEEGYEEDEERD